MALAEVQGQLKRNATWHSEFSGASLCVVGNLNRDVKVQNVPCTSSVLKDGETSVEQVIETIGGGGANSACAAAALGAQVRFVGRVGNDGLGEQLCRAMERHGVTTRVARRSQTPTGTTVALGWAGGHRHFLSCLPNNENLSFEDLDLKALERCHTLLRADVWFSRCMLEGGNERLFRTARHQGLETCLDINFDPAWSSASKREIRHRKRLLRKVLPLVDMAHGNVRELCEFTEAADLPGALRRLDKWGVGSVVVHLGRKGAGFYSAGKLVVEPPSLAARPIHSTGTGDVLSVCMILLARRSELSIREKLRLSNRIVRDFMEGRLALIPEM